jgi:hypothetical protein
MSYMKMLDEIIQYRCGYHPAETDEEGNETQPAVNEASYLQMIDEINQHVSGEIPEEQRLSFEQLSPIAQDVIREWESLIEQENGGGQSIHSVNQAEQPEDF